MLRWNLNGVLLTMLGFLLVMMGSGLEPAAVTDHFAAIEVNRYYDENGKHVFDQLIYRDFGEIRDWRLCKHYDQLPTGRTAIWFDGTCLRKVRGVSVYRTWTQAGVTGDPELEERKQLPKENRRQLTPQLGLKGAKAKYKQNNPMAVTTGSNHER